MIYSLVKTLSRPISVAVFLFLAWPIGAAEQSGVWETLLKESYFKGVNILEDNAVIELEAPYRAEDPALTPLSIKAKIPQTPERYIERIHVIVDRNPQPLAGMFHLTPAMGKADLAMRIRIDQYTPVRAIAVLNNGEHHMATQFVKASGGCSAPPPAYLKAAMQRLGQMRFKTVGEEVAGEPTRAQFMVSHPNITGMQIDPITRSYIPEHYVKRIAISYNDKPLMTAELGSSLSADPALGFFFKPEETGTIKAEVMDSKGMQWSQSFAVNGQL
jgi:sulfur-oxidizing protein SoxY